MFLAYLILLLSKKMELYFPELINNYLSDLLCMPIVLTIARYGIAYWINDARFRLNRWHIISATLAFILFFEIILPLRSSIYTADPFDALMYLLGAFIFWRCQSRSLASALSMDQPD